MVEGQATSVFLRDGEVAAQLLMTAGCKPRLIVAFAAGNSGVGLWFAPRATAVGWRLVWPPAAISSSDAMGRTLHGLQAELEADCDRLLIDRGLVGSVRVLRDHQFDGRLPAHGMVLPTAGPGPSSVAWARNRLDGAAGYALELEVIGGRATPQGPDAVLL
ncbi:MAG: hypothetical protein LH616_06290, partial [Ilumatobacteraceae bacterium]|nr:hypothetical protein [Ilumatobacteraceae bacterium]